MKRVDRGKCTMVTELILSFSAGKELKSHPLMVDIGDLFYL